MAILNICGFETGGTGLATDEGTFTFGFGSIQTSVVRSGQYAFRANPISGVSNGYTLRGHDATGVIADFNVVNTYLRFYIKVVTRPSTATAKTICRIQQVTSGTLKMSVRVTQNGQLEAWDSANAKMGSTGSTVLNTTDWYMIEVLCGTGASASWEVKINGVSEISGTGNLTTTNSGRVTIGTGTEASGDVDFYYDDVCIRDDAYPGPGSIVRLDPISNSADVWTTGGFGDVDDYSSQVGDDTDTTFSTTSTNTDELAPVFTTLANAGIPNGVGVVKCLKAVVVARDESQTVAFLIRAQSSEPLGGTGSSSTTALDGGATYALRAIIREWSSFTVTSSTTFNAEIVHQQSQSRPLRCTAMAVMVDYTPAAVAEESSEIMLVQFLRTVQSEIFSAFIKPIMSVKAGKFLDIVRGYRPRLNYQPKLVRGF